MILDRYVVTTGSSNMVALATGWGDPQSLTEEKQDINANSCDVIIDCTLNG